MKRARKLISLLLVLTIIFSLSSVSAYAKTTKKYSITISAAASLANVMTDIEKLYEKKYPNVKLTFNYGSSGALQKQIEQGSPVDVFLSAATKQMDALKSENLLYENTIRTLLYNDIVLVVPKESKLSISGFKDIETNSFKIIALGEPASVPAGQYAEEVFKYYGNLDTVKKKAVYGKDVTEVLTWVEGGNADVGVVYKTDAMSSDKVKIIATAPAESHSKIEYPGAIVKDSKHPKVSYTFLKFLSGKEAKALFVKYGFITN